eukprot:CAMPEP_0175607818 /NCGR_PEP_ID=MMETSP0096-20121207/61424_1 /TAXON_ID=311494 /ORGANISM="Alexandrium monilatum, Strain CCMP3105" /LENGTH=39 /DNA_ID= /DNA_START= /DNA_END= /DNA_ORIENTATION=
MQMARMTLLSQLDQQAEQLVRVQLRRERLDAELHEQGPG